MSSDQNAITSSTNYIGLTKAALELINTSNPVSQLAHSIVKWQGREHINESDFKYCMEQSRGVAYPNDRGLEIRERILKSENKITRAGGLQLIAAGAVGRWMAFSQDHAYMVTTVAAATKFQGMRFASQLLCELVLMSKEDALGKDTVYYTYSVDRTRLMAVLSKVVESISLNVVNAGHTLGDIPKNLQSLCVHLVDAATLASIILKVSRSNADILLLCDKFQGDVLLWALAHFEGIVEVSVAGERKFMSDSVRGKRHFHMMVKTVCKEGCRQICHNLELLELLGGAWIQTLRGRDDCTMNVSPGQRLPLYTIEPPDYSRQRGILNREETHKVRVLAQRLVLWMMDVPLMANPDFNCMGFETFLASERADVQLRIGDILHRTPAILHDVYGRSSGTLAPLAFVSPEDKESEASDIFYEPDQQPLSMLCECFPAITDLIGEVANRCKCRICRNDGKIDECKEGCLREAILSRVFMLVGNAIADGFGVNDASSFGELEKYNRLVRKVLCDLAEGRVWWDHWFNVAASTTLGYHPRDILNSDYQNAENAGGSSLVAVQYGSNVVAAKWLDLTQKINAHRCFALEMAEGHIPGVQEECTFLFSEVTMKLSCDLTNAIKRFSTDSQELWLKKIVEKDQSEVSLEHAVIASQLPGTSRLLTIISSDSAHRIVDPADTFQGITRSTSFDARQCHCQHCGQSSWNCGEHAKDWYAWTFDKLLTNWEPENKDIIFTDNLDTHLKVNCALGLSPGGCIVRDTASCLGCALEALDTNPSSFARKVTTCEIKEQTLTRR